MTPAGRPVLTETVDARAGVIRVRGRLTDQAADLIGGTAEGLHRAGHLRVVLDVRGLADADRAALAGLRARSAAVGGELRVLGGR